MTKRAGARPGARLLILPGRHGDYPGEAVMTKKQTRYPELTARRIEEFLDSDFPALASENNP